MTLHRKLSCGNILADANVCQFSHTLRTQISFPGRKEMILNQSKTFLLPGRKLFF